MFVVAREVTHDPSPCCFNILDLTKCQTWSRQRAYHKTQGTHCLCDAKRRCHSSAQLLLPCGCMHAEGQIQQQNTCNTLPVKQCSKSPHSCTHTHMCSVSNNTHKRANTYPFLCIGFELSPLSPAMVLQRRLGNHTRFQGSVPPRTLTQKNTL